MPKGKKTTKAAPKPVEATVHKDKRKNLPTADAHDLVTPDVEAPKKLLYPRKPELDPQLVWRGKDELDQRDLEVEAPPIYIQEKIDPRVLIENLRQTAKQGEPEPEATLFDSFDGLGDLDLIDFYQHDANWSNRMILGDSLQVMASLAEREALRGQVQSIYFDPPYGIRFNSNWQTKVNRRDVKDGKVEDIAREVEQIKAFRDTWELGIHSYLSYLRERLEVARALVAESGAVFVQIGDENVHLVRAILDEVFGTENFITQIGFRKTGGTTGDFVSGTVDYILWYAKNKAAAKYRPLYIPRSEFEPAGYDFVQTTDGERRRLTPEERAGAARGEELHGRRFQLTTLTSPRIRENRTGYFPIAFEGQEFYPTAGEWKTHRAGIERLKSARRLGISGSTLRYVRYVDDFAASPLTNLWTDVGGAANPIYVVQTNQRIVERCLLMSTDPGDLVLDPTCGSGTTAYVAEQWGRRWVAIDTSRVALALARQRLMGSRYAYYLLIDSAEGRTKEEDVTGKPLPRATPTNDVRHGFVYERVQHVTLKSIANNPDITEGMSRDDVDAAIKRHADLEVLYDKPYEDSRRVRVTGPFTVESLSPHRSLAFAAPWESSEPAAEREAAQDSDAPTFEQTIMANLQSAGIQNGRRNERLDLDLIEPYAGRYIQAVGARENPPAGTPARVGFSIGPQYGTVSPSFIKNAAREAIKSTDIDLLCVLGFAFDPQAIDATEEYKATDEGFANVAAERQLGRVPVLLVRMNADLVMGEDLKKTGAGNLFTVFGEPEIEITKSKVGIVLTLRGVDVYDPTTGDVRSHDTDQIALWMIDTNYNDESFFVRHCYFTGGLDPYKRLKRALKAEIDEDAWATLYRTESRPFERPETGKIAVKVINDYGDEVMKVFEV